MKVTRNVPMIRFTTANSEYLFTYQHGDVFGTLLCLSGTLAGDVVEGLHVEECRDLAWPGEVVEFTDEQGRVLFRSTPVLGVTRHNDGMVSSFGTHVKAA